MKKRIGMFLAAAMVAVCAWADTWTDPDTGYTWTYRVKNGKAEIVYCDEWGAGGNAAISPSPVGPVTVPSKIGGKPVTSIGDDAFYCCSQLTSVSIPNGVTNIGTYAFGYCSLLASVTLPYNTLTGMGDYCFYECSVLPLISIPDGVKQMSICCFANCRSLQSISLPNSLTSIGDNAFAGCRSLRQISLPTNLRMIGSEAFRYSGLTEVIIPNKVTGIGAYAFCECDSLRSAWIADSVLSLGASAFEGCANLHDVRLSKGMTSVGAYTFANSGVESVIVPELVMSLGDRSFDCYWYDKGYDRYLTNVIFCGSAPAGIDVSKILEHATSVYYPMAFQSSYLQYVPQSIFAGYTESLDLGDGSLPTATYTVVFDSNGGSGTMFNQLFTIGTVQALRANAFYKVGFEFLGWAKSTNGSVAYSDGSTVKDLITENGGVVTLYAVWSASGGEGGTEPMPSDVDVSYALTDTVADRTIASVTVNADCTIDKFVLKDGKVYDTMLRIVNTADHEVKLTLPTGYLYETFEGVDPLAIPANSRNMLSITRTDEKTFLVSREKLKIIQ